jgi:hypothetical protein
MPDPFGRGYPRPIGHIHRYHVIGEAYSTTMVVMFVGLLCWGLRYFCTIPTVGIIRRGSFSFLPEPDHCLHL